MALEIKGGSRGFFFFSGKHGPLALYHGLNCGWTLEWVEWVFGWERCTCGWPRSLGLHSEPTGHPYLSSLDAWEELKVSEAVGDPVPPGRVTLQRDFGRPQLKALE